MAGGIHAACVSPRSRRTCQKTLEGPQGQRTLLRGPQRREPPLRTRGRGRGAARRRVRRRSEGGSWTGRPQGTTDTPGRGVSREPPAYSRTPPVSGRLGARALPCVETTVLGTGLNVTREQRDGHGSRDGDGEKVAEVVSLSRRMSRAGTTAPLSRSVEGASGDSCAFGLGGRAVVARLSKGLTLRRSPFALGGQQKPSPQTAKAEPVRGGGSRPRAAGSSGGRGAGRSEAGRPSPATLYGERF